jgi:hypothetical protein
MVCYCKLDARAFNFTRYILPLLDFPTLEKKQNTIMATHSAIVMVGIKKPLDVRQVPTVKPQGDEVRVRVEWTASTPLDLHQNDGGLLVRRRPSSFNIRCLFLTL